jgi:hypothetical protein
MWTTDRWAFSATATIFCSNAASLYGDSSATSDCFAPASIASGGEPPVEDALYKPRRQTPNTQITARTVVRSDVCRNMALQLLYAIVLLSGR